MTFGLGFVLIAVTLVMVLVARPAGVEPARFLKVWFVGQIYALTALVSAVMGITLVISNRPF
ncbi:MAG TPA: hypothetical protein VFC54_11685 [Pseudolabrys sp.]|nr:hypothetical protein [Pseudolabrys sp.]